MPDDFEELEDDFEERPSKSQIKRELDDLKSLGVRMLEIPTDQLEKLPDPKLIEAVNALRQIRKGSARKRQVQYIGKLLRDETLAEEVRTILEKRDSSSQAHAQAFHRLEQWRERLINEDRNVMDEILGEFPSTDRQHLRQLVRKAIEERKRIEAGNEVPPASFRKLFQYLRELSESD